MRHGEDDVEILDRQQFGLAIFEPLRTRERLALRTVPIAAAVESDALVAAGIALLDVAAQRGRAAALDGAHHAALPTAQAVGMVTTIGRPRRRKMSATSSPVGRMAAAQKTLGGVGAGTGRSSLGNRSKGLVVAHTSLVATFR